MRILLATLYVAIVSILGLLLCLVRPFEANNTRVLGWILHQGVMPLGGLKLKLINKEILDNMVGPHVLISNHQDNFDAFIIGGFVPEKTVSIGKKIIRLFPFFGQIYWLSGNILIDRKRKKKAMGTMNQAAEQMAEKGIRVWIMPEGTRSRGKGLLPFKKGAFHLAKQTNYPLVPVVLSNYAQHMNLNSLKKTTVVAKALEPIDPSKFEDVNALKDHCHHLFVETLKEIDKMATQGQSS